MARKVKPAEVLVRSISNCLRCGKTHRKLMFKRFRRNQIAFWPYWSLCPVSKEPILMRVIGVETIRPNKSAKSLKRVRP